MSEFTRQIRVRASYDYRDDPNDQRGANGAELVLILKGEIGAVTTNIMTGWMARPLIGLYVPGQPQVRLDKPGPDVDLRDGYPIGAEVVAHSFEPRKGFELGRGPCDILESAICYPASSYLAGDKVLELLITGGDDAAFEHLAEIYQRWIVDKPIVPVA